MSYRDVLRIVMRLELLNGSHDVLEIGQILFNLGADKLATGGFWIWEVHGDVEYYSPKFRESLEFEGENDFPSTPTSWQLAIRPDSMRKVVANFEKVMKNPDSDAYSQDVVYRKKSGKHLFVTCNGYVVKSEKQVDGSLDKIVYMIGVHKIIKHEE